MQAVPTIEDIRAGILHDFPSAQHSPVLVVISGLPGTGKTYFCDKLNARLHYVTLESDAIRKKLFPHPTYSPRESGSLFRVIHILLEKLLQNSVSVILDATNLSERNRKPLYRIAEKTNARLILVRVEAPPALVKKRLTSRAKNPGSSKSDANWDIYRKMIAEDEKINRPHYTADSSQDIAPIIEKIVREASR